MQLPAEMDPLNVPPGQGAEITLRSRQGQHLTFGIVESAMQVRRPWSRYSLRHFFFRVRLLFCSVLGTSRGGESRGEAIPGLSVGGEIGLWGWEVAFGETMTDWYVLRL